MKLGKTVVSLLTLIVIIGSPGVALAADHQKTVILDKNQIIGNDYFATGGTVEIAGTVNGDVYVAAGQVLIDGTVNGDVLAVGGSLFVSGTVNGNIRAAAGQVNISGTVSRNITLGAGSIEVTATGVVNGNLVAGGGSVIISGKVDKDITTGTGSLTITGNVNGKVDAASGALTVGSSATVVGPLTYWSSDSAVIDSGAKTGIVTHNFPARQDSPDTARTLGLWSRIYWLLVILLLGALILAIVPNHAKAIAKTIETRTWASLGIGFAGLILIPIVAILLLVTFIGIPLSLILGVMYGIALFIAPLWAILVIGTITARLLKVKDSRVFILLSGTLVYALVGFVPILGALVGFSSLLVGLGGFWLTNLHLYKTLRKEAVI